MSAEKYFQLLAGRLLEAEQSREGIPPITDDIPGFTVREAYQVQFEIVKSKQQAASRIVGKKIGLTSLAMQQMLGVSESTYGHLLNDMEVAEGGVIRLGELMQPRVEAEIAFLLNKDLAGPGVSISDVLRSTEAIAPSLEIADSRIKDWKIKVQDSVADNASGAKFVLGGRLTRVIDFDLSLTGLVFKRNGEILGTAAGAAVLGHPAAAVAWLANKMAEFETTLKAGEVVMSGAFTAAVAPAPGDYFEACFDRLGTAGIRFAD